jgi:sec-independent protein translocase protein TatA
MEALGPWHLLIVAAVFVVLFGAKRLPDAARSLGRSARILKSELKEATHEQAVTSVPSQLEVPVHASPDADRGDSTGHSGRV